MPALSRIPALVAVALIVGLIGGYAVGRVTAPNKTADDFINNQKVEQAIEHDILVKRHKASDVSCPALIEVKKGRDFTCIAVTDHGVQTPFKVRQRDDKGNVTYAAGPVIRPKS